MFKNFINKFINGIMILPRKIYHKHLQKKITNTEPTIISSDCLGGMIYHTLNLKFMSPTINLFFSKNDFISFVNNLDGFLSADLQEHKQNQASYPIGILEFNKKQISIHFMHYKTFEDAKNKWNERKKRINLNNIFVLQLIDSGLTEEDIAKFNAIPYKNKLLITNENSTNNENTITLKVFSKNYYPGKLFSYKSRFSLKRYMDDIDYITFLNNKQ